MSFFQSLVGMVGIMAIGLSVVGALAAVDAYETLKRIDRNTNRKGKMK